MLSLFTFCFCIYYASGAKFTLPGKCPNIVIQEKLDYTKLDGKWYLTAGATDFDMQSNCVMVIFNHKNKTTADVSISWEVNDIARYYNGSVTHTVGSNGGDLHLLTYTDYSTETYYSAWYVNYDHYAVISECHDDRNGSTYKLWILTRKYLHKNCCNINAGKHLNPATFFLSSAAAISLLRMLY